MARPRVFISSTFYNLKQVRASLEEFVRAMGYDPVITDNITYLPDQPLDESCYLEAASCDLFVLIIGGTGAARQVVGQTQQRVAPHQREGGFISFGRPPASYV